jgi:hypothetical protein
MSLRGSCPPFEASTYIGASCVLFLPDRLVERMVTSWAMQFPVLYDASKPFSRSLGRSEFGTTIPLRILRRYLHSAECKHALAYLRTTHLRARPGVEG